MIIEGNFYHDFLNRFEITAPVLVLPVNVSRNHWCLAIADFDKLTFSFIDPMANKTFDSKQGNIYYNKLKPFFSILMLNSKHWI